MKREIKFRVWSGFEMTHDVIIGKFGAFYVNPSNNGLDINDSASLTPFNTKYPDNFPVMQYTGLKDKKGLEIYDGDIIIYNFKTPVTDGEFQSPVFFDEFMWLTNEHSLNRICNIEVIGNIHQNPELL